MTNNNTHPALGLEKIVTRDDALGALKRLSFNCVSYIGKATDKMIVRQALEQSLDGGCEGMVSRKSLIDEFKRLSDLTQEKEGVSFTGRMRDLAYLSGVIAVIETHNLPQPPKSEE